MKDLIKQNYEVTRMRGLITDYTDILEFHDKIQEEVNEMIESYDRYGYTNNHTNEIADVILTCFNYLKHYDIDIEQVLKEKIEINRKRIGK
jgi:NTP pyrophosphatase (non-canonical NTP hydrolase)